MVGLALATAQAHLDKWIAADLALASGQSYSIEGRQLVRADSATVSERIGYWQRVVDEITARAGRAPKSGGGASLATFG